VHGNLSSDQMWVELNGASDEFASAINAVVRPEQPVAAPPVAPAPQPVAEPALVAPPVALAPVEPQVVAVPPQVPVPAQPQPVATLEAQAQPQPAPEPAPEPEPVPAAPLHAGLPTRPTVLPKF
jgi:hypothetical protein